MISKRSTETSKTSGKKKSRADPAAAAASGPTVHLGDPLQYLQQHDGQQLDLKSSAEPFRHYVCSNLLVDSFAQSLKSELLNEKYRVKSNDLYSFRQTRDLKSSKQPHVVALRKLLYSQTFLDLMKSITGIELNNTVDMASLRFAQTDNLLCHDDELEGRRIAYILYLVPPTWTSKDGGALDLFRVDQDGNPADVAVSLVPQWNSFAFFEVSPVSYHQVAEILSPDKERVSISGWFHGAPIRRPPPPPDRPLMRFHRILSPPGGTLDAAARADQALLLEWLNPRYMQRAIQAKVPCLLRRPVAAVWWLTRAAGACRWRTGSRSAASSSCRTFCAKTSLSTSCAC
jgi:Rps23 Pro-64 3,4-dihydroxylase Tpa1-like proline 4-hydroxylase